MVIHVVPNMRIPGTYNIHITYTTTTTKRKDTNIDVYTYTDERRGSSDIK